jgi:K+-transporting ATPase KdpF subunit
VSALHILALAVAVGLLFYLLVALLKPEAFL